MIPPLGGYIGSILSGASATGLTAAGTALTATSVFWSGPGAESAATAWALANNGVTLSMTAIGQAAATVGTQEAWESASEQFASQASGSVQVFSNDALTNYGNIWYNIEWPTLTSNPNITNIVFQAVPLPPGLVPPVP